MDAWPALRDSDLKRRRSFPTSNARKKVSFAVDPNAMNGTGNRTMELRSLFGGDLVSHPVRVRDWLMD